MAEAHRYRITHRFIVMIVVMSSHGCCPFTDTLVFKDMKCCTIWYLEALRKLKKSNVKFVRTVYLTVMPGEFNLLLQTQRHTYNI